MTISTPTPFGVPSHAKNTSYSKLPSSRWVPPPGKHILPTPPPPLKDGSSFSKPFHYNKSKTPSSARTKVATCAHIYLTSDSSKVSHYNRSTRARKKRKKMHQNFLPVTLPSMKRHLQWSNERLDKVHLVIDGGNVSNSPIQPPKLPSSDSRPWTKISIRQGDLHVFDTAVDKGVMYEVPSNAFSPFLKVPRKVALEMTGMTNVNICKSFNSALAIACQVQKGNMLRGKRKVAYSSSKYCATGVKANRAKRGITDLSVHSQHMSKQCWDCMVDYVRSVESVFASCLYTEEIRRLDAARCVIQYPTMRKEFVDGPKDSCLFNSGLAFGLNCYLNVHTDADMSYSVVTVHSAKYLYGFNAPIVAYMCFPRLGAAVAMRPGDLIIFNPQEPHAISSQCDNKVDINSAAMYLKTAVVGLNDNNLPLSSLQQVI